MAEREGRDDDWCFACGRKNPIGLKLNFREENGIYITEFKPGPEHQSYNGIVHGGIISTLLDEVMVRYLYSLGHHAVTARLEVRYRRPTPVNRTLTVTGWIVKERGKLYEMTGKVVLPDGSVTAEGKATVAVIEER
ncbi:PaaI family thioesterase [Propionispora hippei]|uniref:Acyl-coenzyme A thioesterase THEM4 n=1 Tax=Propionispora hippei DSM 15287 TaxID=1123003 RepID=A0A1M6FQN3_9FIRM|nr:PaaI family thioesterase [Propionispora hippei]SHI99964.1 Acyl-coenzyme A thioesterase PaaI, contains HGG motif [Propionispora hippei DSM 15287]